jgi:hypothetical protein
MTTLCHIGCGPEGSERKRWVIGFCPELQNHPTSGPGRRGDLSLPIGPDEDPHPGIGEITPVPTFGSIRNRKKKFFLT